MRVFWIQSCFVYIQVKVQRDTFSLVFKLSKGYNYSCRAISDKSIQGGTLSAAVDTLLDPLETFPEEKQQKDPRMGSGRGRECLE
jgi:hypothetical protein